MNPNSWTKLLLYNRLTSVNWSSYDMLMLNLRDEEGKTSFEFAHSHFLTGIAEA